MSLFLLLTSVSVEIYAQTENAVSTSSRSPLATSAGLLVADDGGNRLLLKRADKLEPIIRSPGCARYHALSPDGNRLGFKSISGELQSPAVVDLSSGRVTFLCSPGPRVGQLSFAQDGRCGFTVGDSLIVINGDRRQAFNLGTYANLAPLSPDGMYAAFNDDNDQIFLLSLNDGSTARITGGTGAYAFPQWSPDGAYLLYSSLGGDLAVYDRNRHATTLLGEGFNPSWSHDSRSIVYYRKSLANGLLLNSDLYAIAPDGRRIRQLTSTPGVCEVDPSFTQDDTEILFRTVSGSEIYAMTAAETGAPGAADVMVSETLFRNVAAALPLSRLDAGVSTATALDIPYVHQVWDTPDWFNGHAACAPTTAVMLLAYYDVLPRWDVGCSGPSYHVSPWGRYVCESYNYRQTPFTVPADDPNGTPSYGGYGFMWASGSPRTTMAAYYTRHGLWAQQSPDYPPHSAAIAEIEAGYPYSMCVGLTAAGHLILAHGVGAEPHTLVFNDPYGNKNMTGAGYPNLYGKNVQYDWPGYNNGNQNLQQVYWCIAVHATVPVQADTLVDDAQLEHGFTLTTQAPASMVRWKDMTRGYGGHFWYCKTTGSTDRDTCSALWRPTLPVAGSYEVSAYIEFSNATAARYRVYRRDGCDTVVVNQKAAGGSWVSLGVHTFDAGNSGAVTLGDGAAPAGQEIVFDAVKWVYQPTLAVVNEAAGEKPERFELAQNYPNPFNPSTTIKYTVGGTGGRKTRLIVYDLLGRQVATLVDKVEAPGSYEVRFEAGRLASGMYIYRLTAGDFSQTRAMMLVR